jgi:hypothetical protein
MVRYVLFALILVVACVGAPVDGPLMPAAAHAQSSDRESRRDEGADRRESRDRRRGGWWGRRDRDEERDGNGRSARDDSRPGSADSPRTEAAATSGSASMNMTDYVKKLVEQHDKNGDKMLDASEQGGLRGRAAAADANNDKVVTIDELVSALSGGSTAAASATSASASDNNRDGERSSTFGLSSGARDRNSDEDRAEDATSQRVFTGSAGGNGGETGKGSKRPSYRFTPASEKLPGGLPGWFKSRDKNGDGQVAMSEYGRTWTTRLVDEFRQYDANDDGIITPMEVAK